MIAKPVRDEANQSNLRPMRSERVRPSLVCQGMAWSWKLMSLSFVVLFILCVVCFLILRMYYVLVGGAWSRKPFFFELVLEMGDRARGGSD